jgi:hypothetical protein
MQDIELYKRILGISSPWMVREVRLELKQRAVTVVVGYDSSIPVVCPMCGGQASIPDPLSLRVDVFRIVEDFDSELQDIAVPQAEVD